MAGFEVALTGRFWVAPDSQKVVCALKRSVIEALNRAPFQVIGIVQNTPGKLCVQVALPNDDPKRRTIHVVLFFGHLHVHVTIKTGHDPR